MHWFHLCRDEVRVLEEGVKVACDPGWPQTLLILCLYLSHVGTTCTCHHPWSHVFVIMGKGEVKMKSLWVFMALGTEPRPLNLEPGEHMLYHTWPKEAIRTKQLIHTNTHTGNTWGRVFYVAKWTTYLRGKDPGEVLILETRQGWANVSSTVLTILATGLRQWRPQKGKSKPLICTGSNAPVATPATLKRANNSAGSQNGGLSGKKKSFLHAERKTKCLCQCWGQSPAPASPALYHWAPLSFEAGHELTS